MTASTPTSVFPGLLSENIDLYRTRPENFLASFLVHAMALAFVFWLATWITGRHNDPGPNVSHAVNVGPISLRPQTSGVRPRTSFKDLAAARAGCPRDSRRDAGATRTVMPHC